MSHLSYEVDRDFPNGVEIHILEEELGNAGIIVDHVQRSDNTIDVYFDQVIGSEALAIITTVVTSHRSSSSIVKRYLANSLIVPSTVEITETDQWQSIGGSYSNSSFLADDLSTVMIAVKGLVDYNGSSTELRLVKVVDGVRQQISNIYSFANINETDEEFSLYVPTGLDAGSCFYVLEARLNDSTHCVVKYVNLIILQIEAVV